MAKKIVKSKGKNKSKTVTKRKSEPKVKPIQLTQSPVKPSPNGKAKTARPAAPPAAVAPAATPKAPPAPLRIKPKPLSDDAPDLLTEADLRKVKTGLSKKDLEHYRGLLMQKRAEILGDVASLETDARNNSGGNLSNMPLHMADIGSDNYEQEFTLGLVESEQRLLKEINEALLRIKNNTYGVCLRMGVPINRARLDITPWAKYCVEAAREMERRGRAG